ncbi:MAG TPA: hypothetical protein VHD62_11115 [Opitutaceae bacterium]|nr:hypothetical protein [Opitutaceae bacterium]
MSVSPVEPEKLRRAAWPAVLAFAAILLGGLVVRASYSSRPVFVPDEEITLAVVGHMRQSGDWDTNWAKAADLSAGLRYDQYNFSSQLYATYFFYRAVKAMPGTLAWRSVDDGLNVYRLCSVLLATLALWLTMSVARRLGGAAAMIGAGILTALSVQLVQDAHYLRPEAFVTALTVAAVGFCWPREKFRASATMAGAFAIGLLIACKVSMLLLAWLPLVPILHGWKQTPGRARWLALGIFPLVIALGFAAGAPGAVAHPGKFLFGVRQLATQYGGMHPPHSHLDGSATWDMLGRYFGATFGWPLLLAGVVGAGFLIARRRWSELAVLGGPVVLFAGYFATKSVFFERNLSHVLPLWFILSAFGAMALAEAIAARLRMAACIMIAMLFVGLAWRPARLTRRLVWTEFSGRGFERNQAFAQQQRARYPDAEPLASSLLVAQSLEPIAQHFRASSAPVILRVSDYRDEWTAACLRQLEARFEAQVVAENAGSFPEVPTSTLLTYHSCQESYFLITKPRATRK